MEYKIIISPEAEKDLTEAFIWYEKNRRGLGFDFLLQVDAGPRLVARNPEIHALVHKGVRGHIIKRFPYKIIYLFENHKVIVLGCQSCPNCFSKIHQMQRLGTKNTGLS